MNRIILIIVALALSPAAWGLDRVQLIQSKIHSSLSSILPSTDYLVIVNRTDTLDDGGASSVVDGTFKPLPGLQLGVDSKGEIVSQNNGSGNYSGAVSINVVIENQVKQDTYKTIEKLLPEIVGGLRDDDEMRVVRGPLRQPASQTNTGPQITIQNGGDQKSQTQENLKFLALLLITGGIFFWFMSRLNLQGQKGRDHATGPGAGHGAEADAKKAAAPPEVTHADFNLLDPEAVALYLMKAVKDKQEKTWTRWVKCTPSVHQREVFRFLPSWILTFFQDLGEKYPLDEQELEKVTLGQLFNEMAMIEQSFKNPQQKKKAFLQWFPAQALRFVPRRHQRSLSEASKATLWSMRPDLGNFLRFENMNVDQVMQEPDAQAIAATCQELFDFPTVAFDQRGDNEDDVISRWTELINQLTEFSPIDSQLEQARAKLSKKDLYRLMSGVAHARSPFAFDEPALKAWLRAVDPNDYYWWQSLVKELPLWNLKEHLRPMRWAMFNEAAQANVHTHWNEEERKKSSERLLESFRATLASANRGVDRGAA